MWIDVERSVLAPADVAAITGDSPVFLSPVTIAELRCGAEITPDPGARQQRLAALRRLQRRPLLPIDADTGEVFGLLAAQLRSSGRSHHRRVQDLWLASQAVRRGYRLLTWNGADFADIPGLDLVVMG